MNAHQLMANSVRALSIDSVQQAKSGHPGAPMGMADMATVLWQKHLRVNPSNPKWDNRDRFVLSNGHASMMLYSLLHLTGFDVSLEDLKNCRQLHSKTAGHPEVHETPGVETTTGPLGQGIANAVGFALAEAQLAAQYNRDEYTVVDHHTYCFLGDGCLMEGVSHEACSLAGTLGLGKLIVLYDANGISIDGRIEPWFGEDVAARFESYDWHVVREIDGHDPEAIDDAINAAKAQIDKPSLIICRTTIGFGSPKFAGSEKCHGAPLGEEEVVATKKNLGLPTEPFSLPEGAIAASDLKGKGRTLETQWKADFVAYEKAYPELAAQYSRVMSGDLPEGFDDYVAQKIKDMQAKAEKVATRKASEMSLNILVDKLPELLGGSADLGSSNLTFNKCSKSIMPHDFTGNYVHYGVREFVMSAIMNGMLLHGGIRPYGGTFLVFSDYMRNGMRMSALMKLPATYVLTHDSIGLGEDGPTHQPVEHVSSMRLIPNLNVWRPCDTVETLVAWRSALNKETPTALALSRQGLPVMPREDSQLENVSRGGYVLKENENAQITLIATGSEVELAMKAVETLNKDGISARVVSMPCLDVFQQQECEYQDKVLPKDSIKLAIEAGSTGLWRGVVGDKGGVIGLDQFGLSAPANELFNLFGFTVDNIVSKAKALV